MESCSAVRCLGVLGNAEECRIVQCGVLLCDVVCVCTCAMCGFVTRGKTGGTLPRPKEDREQLLFFPSANSQNCAPVGAQTIVNFSLRGRKNL